MRKPVPFYKLNLYKSHPFAPLMTSTGCPFSCPYCASSILNKGFTQRPVEKILIKIDDFVQRGVQDFAFYDDALLVNADSHIKLLLKEIVKRNYGVRFHCPNGLHARYIDDELAFLMKESGFKTIRLSLETVDPTRQTRTGGKITNSEFKRTVLFLKIYGFTKKEIGSYLMYGLPGQGLEEVRAGVEFLKSLNIRVNLTEFSPPS